MLIDASSVLIRTTIGVSARCSPIHCTCSRRCADPGSVRSTTQQTHRSATASMSTSVAPAANKLARNVLHHHASA